MAYDPADLRLPAWLVSALDAVIRLRLPLGAGWRLGLTRPGAIFAATLPCVWAAALYSGNNLLYLCACMLLSMGTLALFTGIFLLRSIPDISHCMPSVSTAQGVHVVHQEIALANRFAALAHCRWQGDGPDVHLLIRCEGKAAVQGTLPVPRRALMHYTMLELASEAPLGLWRLERSVKVAGWTWAIVPAPAALPAALQLLAAESGEWRDLRSYARGDAPSRIHWRKSANQPVSDWVVRRFDGREVSMTASRLRVDLRASAGPGFESLLAQAAGWMRSHPEGRLVLGQQAFDLSQAEACLQAWRTLAAAVPETLPPAGSGGLCLAAGELHG